jgi:hypothetical protein
VENHSLYINNTIYMRVHKKSLAHPHSVACRYEGEREIFLAKNERGKKKQWRTG